MRLLKISHGSYDIPHVYHVPWKQEDVFGTPCILEMKIVRVLNVVHDTGDIPHMYHVPCRQEYFFGTPCILKM